MKKYLWLLLIMILLTGCGKVREKDVLRNFQNPLKKSSGYQLKGKLEITNNDEVYSYDVVVDHKKEDFYKVSFVNQANQFQQIILKNHDGVFLLTPSLNKSFKFQSDWPYMNSEIYLLDSLIEDIMSDKEHTFVEKDNQYIIETKVDYPNNKKLNHQKIILNDHYELLRVLVYDSNDAVCMSFEVSKITYSPSYQKDDFELNRFIEEDDKEEEVKETSVIEDILYPLVLPSGTKLVGEEKVSKDSGERVIMTYDGEKSFLLVEETLDVFNDFTIIPTSGEPFQLLDTIGVATENSLSWSSGNMEYYLVSDVMSQEEMVDVAQSIVGVQSAK